MSCRKMVEYVIRKGNHNIEGIPVFKPFIGKYKRIKYGFQLYVEEYFLGKDQYDWNKLPGIIYGSRTKCSCRLAWRRIGDKFEYAAYIYDRGKRIIKLLPHTGDIGNVEISNTKDKWNIIINGSLVNIDKTKNTWYGYKGGGPYFGGNRVAQEDILIKVDYELF